MTITSAMPKAVERKRRTRTKRVSSLPAIKLSDLLPSHIDLRDPLQAVLVCPSCTTWCPITGTPGKIQKLVPHHTGKAGEADAIRCRSSNRLIDFDVTITGWYQALTDASTEASSRQATTVLPKAFSPATDRTLRARAQRTPAGRTADWNTALRNVVATDAMRRSVPAGDAPAEAPAVPLTPLHPQRSAR
ncbi:hypothetical protein QFZ75_000062 [Streptomyces sp. V3I8]|uniref:hypothetical protein n=1 Tax=Streptomyces sp. V3I8 TaxID=3042279 RepID=UPI00278B1761|nr:hypothetical protein [Streptomyces sp. V3I8]MDQ1033646.1 hypothetical protein [Streptomyces sp. V3I8]